MGLHLAVPGKLRHGVALPNGKRLQYKLTGAPAPCAARLPLHTLQATQRAVCLLKASTRASPCLKCRCPSIWAALERMASRMFGG